MEDWERKEARDTTSEDKTAHALRGAAFLTSVASAGMLAGFGSALMLAKKKNPDSFNKGVVSAEGGASLALRALGWGSLFAWCGVGLLSATVWKLLGVHSLTEFRLKMASIFPSVPKSAAGSPPPDWDAILASKATEPPRE